MRSTADVIRGWFDAFERGDMEAARALLAESATLHASYPPEIAGDHVGGLDEFLAWYERKKQLAGEDFAYEVHDLLATDAHGVALLTLRASRSGKMVEWPQVAVYHVRDGKITEIWLHEEPPSLPSREGPRARVVCSAEMVARWQEGVTILEAVSPATMSTDTLWFALGTAEPGVRIPPHYHTCETVAYLIRGRAGFGVGEDVPLVVELRAVQPT